MSETCIVCLGDLGGSGNEFPHQNDQVIKADNSEDRDVGWDLLASPAHKVKAGSELIAHLLPCGHNLHDECLKPWVERANSCPICRQSFNTVELVVTVGGELSSIFGLTCANCDAFPRSNHFLLSSRRPNTGCGD